MLYYIKDDLVLSGTIGYGKTLMCLDGLDEKIIIARCSIAEWPLKINSINSKMTIIKNF